MGLRSITAASAALVCLWAQAAPGQDGTTDLGVLEGGFQFDNPKLGAPEGSGGGVVTYARSSGDLVVTGGRIRSPVADAGRTVCVDLVYTLQAADLTRRKSTSLVQSQRKQLQIQFAFFDCTINASNPNGGPKCVLGKSEPAAQESCRGLVKVKTSSKAGPDASVRVRCKDRIESSSPVFDLTPQERAWVDLVFPSLVDGLDVKYKDRAASEISIASADSGLNPTLGLMNCPQ